MANGLRVAHIPPKIQGWRVFFWVVGLGLGNIGCLCHKKLFWNSCSFKIQNISKNCVFMFFSWYCFFGSNISNQNDSSMDPNVQTHTGGMPYTVLSVPCDERNAKFRTSPKWIKAASTCQMCSWKFLSRTLNFCTQCNYYYRRYQDRVDAFLSLTLVSFPMTLLGIKKRTICTINTSLIGFLTNAPEFPRPKRYSMLACLAHAKKQSYHQHAGTKAENDSRFARFWGFTT